MPAFRPLALLLTVLPASGCALVPIPLPRSCPGPIIGVRVLDAQTGRDVADATVTCSISPHTNWTQQWPASLREVESGQAPEAGEELLDTRRRSDGLFVMEPKWKVRAVRPFGPGPLGWALYDDYRASICVSTQDGRATGLSYCVASPPDPGWEGRTAGMGWHLDANGVMEVRVSAAHGTNEKKPSP